MSEPLTTWYCDVCGEKIEKPEDGYVIWKSTSELGYHDFKIIHMKKCDLKDHGSSNALKDFLGDKGLAKLLSFLSAGPIIIGMTGHNHRKVLDINEFVDFIRRVQTPYYEEARRNFSMHEVIEALSGSNEVYPYLPEVLKHIATEY